jgi:hypothetical protein
MKRHSIFVVAIFALSFFVPLVNAATIDKIYTYDPDPNVFLSSTSPSSVTTTFNFAADFQSVTGATLAVWVYDNNDSTKDRFQINVGNPLSNIFTYPNNTDMLESSTKVSIGSVYDYIINKTLQAQIAVHQSTNFFFDKFELTVTGNPVPVPAAAWLLGSGLLGLIFLKRRTN